MESGVKTIKARTIQNYTAAISLSDSFFIFDSYADAITETGDPMRLDIVNTITCIEGFLRIKIGYTEFTVRKDEFIILLPNNVFQVLEVSKDFKARVICMQPHFFDFDLDHHGYDTQKLLREFPHQSLTKSKVKLLDSLFYYMKDLLLDKKHLYRRQIVDKCLKLMFYELCDMLIQEDIHSQQINDKNDILKKFTKHIEQNFRKERKVSFYAQKAHLTPKYFSTFIRTITGRYAKEWIDEYIILEAKAMLNSTNMNIQQISYELNFATPSHFGRFFRRYTGVSPLQYRNRE